MQIADFDYNLPAAQIAQQPLGRRDASRLLLLERSSGGWADREFVELPDLLRGDELLVFNNTRVIPARLFGRRVRAHAPAHSQAAEGVHYPGNVEVFLIKEIAPDTWEALVRPGRKMRVGELVAFGEGELEAEIVARGELGLRTVRFSSGDGQSVALHLEQLGHVPLPPYIERQDQAADRERYQTIFAKKPGAVAAPTAGLHFSAEILERIRGKGVETCEITLHVGLGTFQPIHTQTLAEHVMHKEIYEIPQAAADQIIAARAAGKSIVAVGTTVVRALEDAAQRAVREGNRTPLIAGSGTAGIFITPGYGFQVVDALLTNFHLPRSTLLALVSAFAGRENVLAAYRHAVEAGYRFYSYGDCMLIR